MKILFVCGSLEPGKDGVGDYVQVLASRLRLLGHEIFALSLNDRYIKENFYKTDGIYRISYELSWNSKKTIARNLINDFGPDLISFHFVPFSFNNKGLLGKEKSFLADILYGYPLHLMLHELWVEGHTLKLKLWSLLQRRAIISLINLLKPLYLHTSNEYYIHRLMKYGFRSNLYPVFSNISFSSKSYILYDKLKTLDSGIEDWYNSEVPVFMSFGSIHPQAKWDELIDLIIKEYGMAIFVSIGRMGPGEKVWSDLKKKYKSLLKFIEIGNLDSEELSCIIRQADFGITTNPEALLKKSGSVAAFLEHGVPVLYMRREYSDQTFIFREEYIPSGCFHVSLARKIGLKQIIRDRCAGNQLGVFPEDRFVSDVIMNLLNEPDVKCK